MTFQQLLTAWNKGVDRGVAKNFAAKIGVTDVTVWRWLNGVFVPDEHLLPKIAKELNISVEDLMESLKSNRNYLDNQEELNLIDILTEREIKALRMSAEDQMRDIKGMVRWLVREWVSGRLRPVESLPADDVLEGEASVRASRAGGEARRVQHGKGEKQRVVGSDRKT